MSTYVPARVPAHVPAHVLAHVLTYVLAHGPAHMLSHVLAYVPAHEPASPFLAACQCHTSRQIGVSLALELLCLPLVQAFICWAGQLRSAPRPTVFPPWVCVEGGRVPVANGNNILASQKCTAESAEGVNLGI